MRKINLFNVIVSGGEGDYYLHIAGREDCPPIIHIKVDPHPVPPHNHISIKRIFDDSDHVIASANNIEESDHIAHDMMIKEIANSIGYQLCDAHNKPGQFYGCWYLAEDKTHNNRFISLEVIFSHLKKYSKEMNLPPELVNSYGEETCKILKNG